MTERIRVRRPDARYSTKAAIASVLRRRRPALDTLDLSDREVDVRTGRLKARTSSRGPGRSSGGRRQ